MRERTARPSFLGAPMRLCLFFAANPDERLTTSAVAEMLSIPSRGVTATMAAVAKCGLVGRDIGGGRAETVYFAGPKLLEAIRLPLPADEDAVTVVRKPAGTWRAEVERPATWMPQ